MKSNYYQRTEFVSNSELTRLKFELLGRPLPNYQEAQRFGSLFDAVLTDPGAIDDVAHDAEDLKKCEAMARSFRADPFAKLLDKSFNKQVEVFKQSLPFKYDGVDFTLPFKGRFDYHRHPIIADLKSTDATSQKQFEAAIDFFDYDRQGAAYMKLTDATRFMVVGVSKSRPHLVFKIAIERGDKLHKQGLEKLNFLAFKKWIV